MSIGPRGDNLIIILSLPRAGSTALRRMTCAQAEELIEPRCQEKSEGGEECVARE